MKVNELLNETSAHETILSNVANELYLKIKELVHSDNPPVEVIGGQEFMYSGEIGKLKELVNSKTLGRLYTRLGQVTIELLYGSNKNKGEYDYIGKPVITIFVSDLVETGNDEGMASTLAHELKHALDDSVNKGIRNRHDSKTNYGMRSNKHTTKQDRYMDQEIEINARFTEAAMVMKKKIDEYGDDKISNSTLMHSIILPILHDFQLSKIFKTTSDNIMRGAYEIFGGNASSIQSVHPMDNKYFRKLLSRMYKYARE